MAVFDFQLIGINIIYAEASSQMLTEERKTAAQNRNLVAVALQHVH